MSSVLVVTQDERTAPLGTLVWGLKASNRSDQKAVRACSGLILTGWGRGNFPNYAVPRYTHLQPANPDRGVQGDSTVDGEGRVCPKQGFDVGIMHNDNTFHCFA